MYFVEKRYAAQVSDTTMLNNEPAVGYKILFANVQRLR
jgi:hypothetical protein